MPEGLNKRRTVAMCISLCLVSAQLMTSAALACEGWPTITKEGEGELPCNFTKIGQKCNMKIDNNTNRVIKINNVEIKGVKANERYEREKIGCNIGKKGFKKGDECTDVIKVLKFEAKTQNEYCILFEDEKTGEMSEPCELLKMV
jgi:hypothetical protein